MPDRPSPGLAFDAPAMGAVIHAFGLGISDAQARLDIASLRVARAMAGLGPAMVSAPRGAPPAAGSGGFAPVRLPSGASYNLLELGFTPSFYRFTEAVLELKVTVSVSLEEAQSGPDRLSAKARLTRHGVKLSTINGSHASRYQYSGESSSRIRSRIVAVAAPALLEARVSAMMRRRRAAQGGGA
jgi:hypothetical protein